MVERVPHYLDEYNYNKKISIALVVPFIVLSIQYFVLVLYGLAEDSTGSPIQLLSKAVVGIVYLYTLPALLKRNAHRFFCTYFIAIFIFFIHYIIFSENQAHLNSRIFSIFFTCLPGFVYALALTDWTIFRYYLKKASKIIFVFSMLIGGLILSGYSSITYSMSFSYYMLFSILVYLDEYLEKPSLQILLPIIFMVFFIVSYGSRGPLFCIGVFIILRTIISSQRLNYLKILMLIFGIMVLLVLLIYSKDIIKFAFVFSDGLGISSRSLLLFQQDEIYMSGRDSLYSVVWEEFKKNPITGLGLGGDGRVLGGSGYVHNFFLEVLADLGIIAGVPTITILVFSIIKSLFSKDKEKIYIVVIWLCIGFVPLMVSGSFLLNFMFWIFMGVIFNRVNCSKSV